MALYRRILVAFDGSDTSRQALAAALQLAKDAGGRVLVLHDISDLHYLVPYADPGVLLEDARTGGEQILRGALGVCQSAGVPAESRLIDAPGRPLAEAVADEARSWKADLVVLGSHGRRGLQRLLLGSGAEQILRLSPVPTLVVRAKPPA